VKNKSFGHPIGIRTDERVKKAIRECTEKRTPKNIHAYLLRQAEKKKDILYNVSSSEEMYVPSLRSVKESLKRLTIRMELENEHGVYRFHDRMKFEYRYFGRRFAETALHYLMRVRYPATYNVEENTDILIDLFGTYVLYCFIEAMRSIKGSKRRKADLENLMSSWVQDALNPANMFIHFATIMDNQLDNNGTENTNSNKEKPLSFLPFIEQGVVKSHYRRLDDAVLMEILESIEKSHPEYIDVLNNVRERILFEIDKA
jgi:hypothetical protein